jgi:hypothetical protein
MKILSLIFVLLSPSAFAGSVTDIKTAACSDAFMTTFVRLDRTGSQSVMYGMFYHLPSVSNTYLPTSAAIDFTNASPDSRFQSYNTLVADADGGTRGTLLLAFRKEKAFSLQSKEEALAAFVNESGDVNWSIVDCCISF